MAADLFDSEFQQNLTLAKVLISKLRDKGDRKIAVNWITKLCNLNPNDPLVKKNRNYFFKYFLQVLHQNVQDEAKSASATAEGGGDFNIDVDDEGRYYKFVCHWSPDKRTYVAARPLPGQGALVYMAVAKDPTMGWDIPSKR